MIKPRTFYHLQQVQFKHDEEYHADITQLPTFWRLNHLTHHLSKYAGRLVESFELPDAELKLIEDTATDTFIIALSMANALNLDLDKELSARNVNLNQFEAGIKPDYREMRARWLYNLVKSTGRMSKALESLDHLEASNDPRKVFEEEIVSVMAGVVSECNYAGFDVVKSTLKRWKYIEENRVL